MARVPGVVPSLMKRIDDNALCHCASVVPPVAVSVSTPVVKL